MDGRGGITADLVHGLLAEQAPHLAGLPVVPVEPEGNDNRTYRLGADLSVRLPSHPRYGAAVAKEDRWLPVIAPQVPLPVPQPVFRGEPSATFGLPRGRCGGGCRGWSPQGGR